MPQLCQAYTCLFDISRDKIDGRSLDLYQNWLKETIKMFPGIVVYCESVPNHFKNLNANFVIYDQNQLEAFKHLQKVNEVLSTFKAKSPNDMTFLLPKYSLVQLSKFELAVVTSKMISSPSLLWVDAGVSRFLTNLGSNNLELNSGFLLDHSYSYAFEIDLRNNMNYLKAKALTPPIGSSKRLVSGTSFWIKTSMAQQFNAALNNLIIGWLNQGKWDNEQIALRFLFKTEKSLKNTFFIPQKDEQTGSVARSLLNSKLDRRYLYNKFYYYLMS